MMEPEKTGEDRSVSERPEGISGNESELKESKKSDDVNDLEIAGGEDEGEEKKLENEAKNGGNEEGDGGTEKGEEEGDGREKVIAPTEDIEKDMAEANEKQEAQAKENVRRAQLVYPGKTEHEDPREKKKKHPFAGFSKKLTKFMSLLLFGLFVALLAIVIYKIVNVNYVAADKFILIGAQPNMVLGSETYVFDDYKEYVKKTMGAGGLSEEDFGSAKYGLVSIPYENCGEAEKMVEVQGANTEGNVVKVQVVEKASCEGAGTMYVNYLFPINKDLAEPTVEIEFVEGGDGEGENVDARGAGGAEENGGDDESVQGGGTVDVQKLIEKLYTGQ